MAERADDRLVRLLGMVAYLDGAGPVPVAQLAARFGVSPAQIHADVDALWVSGTPGYWPDDLIDFDAYSFESGVVRLTESRGMTRPLRLGPSEAVALVAALRAMREVDAVAIDPARAELVESALAKLTEATGEAADALDVRLAAGGDPQVIATLTSALRTGRRLRIRYVTGADTTSEREIDPIRLHTTGDRSYLASWCYRADGPRTFRVDRVLAATVLDQAVAEHTGVGEVDLSGVSAAQAPLATLVLASSARWFAEEVPVETVTNLPDGDFEVTLHVTNPDWLRRVLLENATQVRSVSPPELAEQVRAAATDALALYDPPHDQRREKTST